MLTFPLLVLYYPVKKKVNVYAHNLKSNMFHYVRCPNCFLGRSIPFKIRFIDNLISHTVISEQSLYGGQ